MIIGNFTKQPSEVTDYDIDFEKWLVGNDLIDFAVVTIDGVGLNNPQTIVSSSIVKVWLSGGNNDQSYKITVTATTDAGRVKQVEFKVKVKDT